MGVNSPPYGGSRQERATSPLAGGSGGSVTLPHFFSHIGWLCSSKMTQSKQSSSPLLPLLPLRIQHRRKTNASRPHPHPHFPGARRSRHCRALPGGESTVQDLCAGASGGKRCLLEQPENEELWFSDLTVKARVWTKERLLVGKIQGTRMEMTNQACVADV